MTSVRSLFALLFVLVGSCGDDGVRNLPDAPPDAAIDAAIDAPGDVDLTITPAGNGSGRITSFPGGLDCGATCTADFAPGTEVTLTAEPANGSLFTGWSGACTGTSPVCTVTLAAVSSVTATFTLKTYVVQVSKIGVGTGTVSGSGIACGATCMVTVDHGTMISLAAAPAALSTFAGWGGPCSGTGTCAFTVNTDTTITAAFALDDITLSIAKGGTGTGTVTSAPVGINCGIDCDETYVANTMVTLTAAAAVGSTFTGFTGGNCTGTAPCTITMTAAVLVTATFALNTYPLTVTTGGNGTGNVTSTPSGIACGGDCTETYNHGQMVTLTATPGAGSTLTWGGACTGSGACVVTMDAAKTVTATFTLNTYALTVTTGGNGAGSVSSAPAGIACPGACTASYNHGVMVALTAAPAVGSTFMWGGACSGNGACVVTMDAVKSVTATFTLNTYALGVTIGGNGSGTVSSTPAGIACPGTCTATYNHGVMVTLTAAPVTGSTVAWTGACTGSGACVVTMDAAKSVTATFTLNTYALGVTIGGNGSGTVSSTPAGITCPGTCTATYNHGQVINLTAAPTAGSTFAWGGACTGSGACSVTMDAVKNVTATFTLNTYPLSVALAGTGTGTVASVPAGIACPGTCSNNYNHGQMVTLTATATGTSIFTGWTGDCTGTSTCTVTMLAARSVTATFTPTFQLTTSISTAGTGLGTITSAPAGINCPTTCAENYASGSTVVLTATPNQFSVFTGWGGGCSGTGTCTVTMSGVRSVTATFQAPNMMFVSSLASTGNLGGVGGADATCRTLATNAGLLGTGPGKNATWRAWLSSSGNNVDAVVRMNGAAGWIRTDGKPVFATVSDIAADRLVYPPRLTESGVDVGAGERVWTGTAANGFFSDVECTGGTAAVIPWGGTNGTGTTGYASGNSSIFTNYSALTCTQTARLYCMGVDRVSVIPPAVAETGRFAFTSRGTYTPNSGGLGTADAICAGEASSAGLPGSYLALISTTTATALSRFNTGGLPWIRAGDRIRIAPTAAALGTTAALTVAPNVTADGALRFGNVPVWTGAASPGSLGMSGLTCSDWTTSGKGTSGRAGDTGVQEVWFNASPAGPSCTLPNHRVICLQR